MFQLERCKENPILRPNSENWWEAAAIFNPAASLKGGRVHLFPRVIGEYEDYISRVAHYVSEDGVSFEPAFHGPIFGPAKPYDRWGCEDPRVTEIEGVFYFSYVALSKPVREGGGPPATALISTKDFRRFRRHGLITPYLSDNKDVVLFPEKIKGKYVMLHRPKRWTKAWMNKNDPDKDRVQTPYPYHALPQKPAIWIAYSFDLARWFDHHIVMESQEWWEEKKIGGGAPPIKTEAGWLIIYHGVSPSGYRAGAALLDLENPSKVIGRTKDPILEPQEGYERMGDVSNVVFPEGALVINEKLFVYYGAADKYVALATCSLKELLENLKE